MWRAGERGAIVPLMRLPHGRRPSPSALVISILLLTAGAACGRLTGRPDDLTVVRDAIAERYAHQADAYRRRDAEAFLENLEPDFTAHPLQGGVATRQMAAAGVRARMGRIEDPEIAVTIDSIKLLGPRGSGASPDSVEVYNVQRFSRRIRDDAGTSRTVVSSQRHRERWRRTAAGWRIYYLQELGGMESVGP